MFDLSPEAIEAWSRIGVVGFFLVLAGLFLARRIITMGEKRDADAASDVRHSELRAGYEARLDEIKTDRDEWRTFAKEISNKMSRLTDALEASMGRKFPEG